MLFIYNYDINYLMNSAKINLIFFLAASVLLSINACRNAIDDIPFPNEPDFKAVTEPLQFSEPIRVIWDSSKVSHIKPLIKKFDFNKLPSGRYDSTGYHPFLKPPVEVSFNWDSLPEKKLHLDSIPAKPLTFKTYLIRSSKDY